MQECNDSEWRVNLPQTRILTERRMETTRCHLDSVLGSALAIPRLRAAGQRAIPIPAPANLPVRENAPHITNMGASAICCVAGSWRIILASGKARTTVQDGVVPVRAAYSFIA